MKFPLATFLAVGNVPKRGHGRSGCRKLILPSAGRASTPTPNRKDDMTRHLERIFYAGLTKRWHTNAHLSGTCDRLDGHQARVARIILALWPDASRELLIAALTHDDGESVIGDIPATYGKMLAQIEDEVRAKTDIWGYETLPLLSPQDTGRLHLADKLDAYMWAEHHAPAVVLDNPEWSEAWQEIVKLAVELGVEDRL